MSNNLKDNKPQTLKEALEQFARGAQSKHWGWEETQDGARITAYWLKPLKERSYTSQTFYCVRVDGKIRVPAELLKRSNEWTFCEILEEIHKKLVLFFTEGVWDMPLLTDFLRTNCNVTEPEQLGWENIIKRLIWFAEKQGIKIDDIKQYPKLTFTMWCKQQNTVPLSALKNPVTCAKVGGIISKRSDNIAGTLKRRGYLVIKSGGKFYCDAEQAGAVWLKWKKYWQKQKDE